MTLTGDEADCVGRLLAAAPDGTTPAQQATALTTATSEQILLLGMKAP
jgi:hypothetical protein